MTKFKVGDRVMISQPYGWAKHHNRIGTILEITKDKLYVVKGDDFLIQYFEHNLSVIPLYYKMKVRRND